MSASVSLDTVATAGRWTRGACAWLLAAMALAGCDAAFAQATNSIDSLAVSKGASGRTIVKFTLKNAPANPPAATPIRGFSVSRPAAMPKQPEINPLISCGSPFLLMW